MDWKEQLAKLHRESPEPETELIIEEKTDAGDEENFSGTQTKPLLVVYDRKGRKGKCATIIEGFELPQREIKTIAGELKKRLATGGSMRDSDILIQGERGPEVCNILAELGFKTKRQGF